MPPLSCSYESIELTLDTLEHLLPRRHKATEDEANGDNANVDADVNHVNADNDGAIQGDARAGNREAHANGRQSGDNDADIKMPRVPQEYYLHLQRDASLCKKFKLASAAQRRSKKKNGTNKRVTWGCDANGYIDTNITTTIVDESDGLPIMKSVAMIPNRYDYTLQERQDMWNSSIELWRSKQENFRIVQLMNVCSFLTSGTCTRGLEGSTNYNKPHRRQQKENARRAVFAEQQFQRHTRVQDDRRIASAYAKSAFRSKQAARSLAEFDRREAHAVYVAQ